MTTATATAEIANNLSVMALFAEASLFVKGIMFLLLLLSIVTWTILFSKYKAFRKLRNQARNFEDAFWGNQKGLEELYRHTQPEDTEHPMAKLYVIGLREWEQATSGDDSDDDSTFQMGVGERISQLLTARMTRELEKLENTLPTLATIGSTAPFVGLLGTVWGIMNSFQSIGAAKNTSLAIVAPGVAEALLATALGLFAAIPAVVAYNKLSTELGRYAARLEAFVVEFSSMIERQSQEKRISARKNKRGRRKTDQKQAS